MTKLETALARAQARKSLPMPPARRLLRKQAGLTQRDIASALGVSSAAVAYWEAGTRSPRDAVLTKYVEILQRCAREGLA